ncbi:MAG: hypothetical protein PHY92_07605, partial [Alphaproteobacteria bacterium]|nr:hypothetical protein [Alphaproteobacteria bacterium]
RNNQPIADHYLQVFHSGTLSKTKKMVGILHDVVEDTDWTLDDLREVGFPEKVVRAVGYVTRLDEELYFDSIERCGESFREFGNDHYAIDPKIADLSHNMSVDREGFLLEEGYKEKLNVYVISRNYLVAIKKGEIDPGTPVAEFMQMRNINNPELLAKYSSRPCRTALEAGQNGAPKVGAPAP